MKIQTNCILALIVSSCLIACNNKKDEDPPIINKAYVNVLNRDSLFNGGVAKVFLEVSDNISVKGVRAKLREQKDTYAYKAAGYDEQTIIMDGSGKLFEGELMFQIDDEALAAPYLFELSAFDGSGNESEIKTLDVYIYSEKMPDIYVDTTSLVKNDTNYFVPKGSIYGVFWLKEIEVSVFSSSNEVYSQKWTYSSGVLQAWNLDSIGSINLGGNFTNGELIIKCLDNVGNINLKKETIRP